MTVKITKELTTVFTVITEFNLCLHSKTLYTNICVSKCRAGFYPDMSHRTFRLHDS